MVVQVQQEDVRIQADSCRRLAAPQQKQNFSTIPCDHLMQHITLKLVLLGKKIKENLFGVFSEELRQKIRSMTVSKIRY